MPDEPTEADLEAVYVERGARLVECDAARRLAIDTLLAERVLRERWRLENESRSGGRPPSR